jgi:hypothetical protein
MTIYLDAALVLASRGFHIFPCRPRSKQPLINDNLNRATTDPNIIRGWWAKGSYNIAIATGAKSDLWVLDVDDEIGKQTLRALQTTHGKLPETATVITGKGRHLYFRWPVDVEIRNSQHRADLPNLDVRGDGGYVIAPPSFHPSGAIYRWADVNADFVPAPAWLVGIVTKAGVCAGANAPGAHTQATPPDAWCSFLGEHVAGSRRGGAVARLSGMLLRKYLDPMVVLDLARLFNGSRCDPPLPDDELISIVGNVCEREHLRREERWS